jgi:ribosomal protein S18 acetylase RimI-like enzyme
LSWEDVPRTRSFCSGPFGFYLLKLRLTKFEERLSVSISGELTPTAHAAEISEAGDARHRNSPAISAQEVHLEPASPADESFIYATFASTRTEELSPTGWSDEQKEQFLRMQFEAQRQSYLRDLPEAEYTVIRCGSAAVGRLIVERTPSEIHIVDIALLTQFRKQGIGSILMRRMLGEAEQTGKSVRLFVEKFNPALRWYERMGFEVVSTGPMYLEMIWRPALAVNSSNSRLHK